MRGEREKSALTMIRRFIFCDKMQQPLIWDNKIVYDFNDDEYKENINCCTNFDKKSIYGLSLEDFYIVTNALRKATLSNNSFERNEKKRIC